MSGPLNSIFASCESVITPCLVAAGITGTTYGHSGGERYLEASTPRIVWVPTIEEISTNTGLGGDAAVIDGWPLATRQVDVETDIWGADRDTVEAMIPCVFSGVHDSLGLGSYGVRGARWLLPEEIDKNGEVYRITFQFMVPVVRVDPSTTTVTVTAIPETPTTLHLGS